MTNEIIEVLKQIDLSGKVLDVGSLDVNGNIRELCGDYTGIDIMAGPNVDVVIEENIFPFENNYFDVVLCLNTLEHDKKFWRTLSEMWLVLKPGGILFIEVPNFHYKTIHNHPADYYRFSEEALRQMFIGFQNVTIGTIPGRTDLIYGYGTKA